MLKTTKVKITGLAPLLMHNGCLADPLHESSIALARLSGKRNKTIEDHEALSETEWRGSLYVDDKGRPCLPGEVIEGALAEGAKKTKRGKDAKAAIMILGDYVLKYNGPKTVDALWEHGGYSKRAGVRIGKNRVIRTRPMFPEWSCEFEIQWDPSVIKSERDLLDIVEDAGRCGIGDWRPKFGRFQLA